MNGWAIFLIIFLLTPTLGFVAWTAYTRIRAQRLGLPPPPLNPFASASSSNYPAPAPGGIRGWIDTQIRRFKNRRHATGAYEEPTSYSGARGAGHRLDPDEAWDARVGNEAYYEEQELGLHPPAVGDHTEYRGGNEYGYGYSATVSAGGGQGGLGAGGGIDEDRGRSRSRGFEDPGLKVQQNPFGDDNAVSLRGVSPRPLDTESRDVGKGRGSEEDSPTERRSIFRENM